MTGASVPGMPASHPTISLLPTATSDDPRLAMWRLPGLDTVLREAWEAGVVLTGVSGGSICWPVGGTTDSFGPELRPVTDGFGFLPHANGVGDGGRLLLVAPA